MGTRKRLLFLNFLCTKIIRIPAIVIRDKRMKYNKYKHSINSDTSNLITLVFDRFVSPSPELRINKSQGR